MITHYFFTNSQSNTCSRIFLPVMKSLKKFENLVFIQLIKANSIVPDADFPMKIIGICTFKRQFLNFQWLAL